MCAGKLARAVTFEVMRDVTFDWVSGSDRLIRNDMTSYKAKNIIKQPVDDENAVFQKLKCNE